MEGCTCNHWSSWGVSIMTRDHSLLTWIFWNCIRTFIIHRCFHPCGPSLTNPSPFLISNGSSCMCPLYPYSCQRIFLDLVISLNLLSPQWPIIQCVYIYALNGILLLSVHDTCLYHCAFNFTNSSCVSDFRSCLVSCF